MNEERKIKSSLIKGIFHFIESSEYSFKGSFRKGLRPFIWYTQVNGEATSCALISDIEIHPGEKKEAELFILNELQLGVQIREGMLLSIGSIYNSEVAQFGEFEVLEHLGEWQGGKIP